MGPHSHVPRRFEPELPANRVEASNAMLAIVAGKGGTALPHAPAPSAPADGDRIDVGAGRRGQQRIPYGDSEPSTASEQQNSHGASMGDPIPPGRAPASRRGPDDGVEQDHAQRPTAVQPPDADGKLPPERLAAIVTRLREGFYDQETTREAIAKRIVAELGTQRSE